MPGSDRGIIGPLSGRGQDVMTPDDLRRHVAERDDPPRKALRALPIVRFNRSEPTVLSTTTWKVLGRLATTPGHDTTRIATTWKALGRPENALGETTPPATTSKALGALAVAEQDILPAVG